MLNPADEVKDWVAKEITKAKLDAQIAALECLIEGIGLQVDSLKAKRIALG